VEVREATAEVEPGTGSVIGVFTSGTTVQLYVLANSVPSGSWTGIVPEVPPKNKEVLPC